MAKNSWNSWISQINFNDVWEVYNDFKSRDNNFRLAAKYKHKSSVCQPNRVLFLEVLRATIKVTTHVLYHVLCSHGEVQRIVIYRKFRRLYALVEFVSEEDAKKVVDSSDCISLDYFTLMAEYAKVSSLNIVKNNELTWDYTKEPILQYVDGLTTLKSPNDESILDQEDSLPEIKSSVVIKQYWEIVEDFDLVEIVKIREKPSTDKSDNHWSVVNNGKTKVKRPEFRASDKCSVLSVNGLDPAKSNCDRLFRLLSMYASVTKINYSRELNSADVEFGKCVRIDAFAQIQQFTLLHGNNLSFRYLQNEWSVVHRAIDRFVLPDKSSSYVNYDGRIQTDLSPGPSKTVRFYGAPPNINHDELVSLLKSKMSIEKFVVKIMTKGTKKKVAYGEIKFDTVPEAIEAIMCINYIVFRSKDDKNKKKYVLNLVFSP